MILNSLLDNLILFDQQLFLKINTQWTNSFCDFVFPAWRNAKTWIPMYALIIMYTAYKYKINVWKWILGAAILVLISDQFSSHLIKPLVGRLRPCNEPALEGMMRLLVNRSPGFSFTSSHACNHFAVAFFFHKTLRPFLGKWGLLFFVWAATISYGQVYVGVHYPLDITCGAILGSVLGMIFANFFNKKILPFDKFSVKE